jgi:hypothetical protein
LQVAVYSPAAPLAETIANQWLDGLGFQGGAASRPLMT